MRDRCCDTSRDGMGRPDRAALMSDIPFQVTTIQNEIDDGGWTELTEPVGGEPVSLPISGTEGC